MPGARFRSKEDLHVIHSLGEWFGVNSEPFDYDVCDRYGTKGSCAVALLLDESSLVALGIRPFFEKIFLDHYRRDLSSSGPIDLVLLRRLALSRFAG